MTRNRFRPASHKKKKSILDYFSLKSLFQGNPPDTAILFSVAGLVVLGWIMVYSASALVAENRFNDQYFFIKRHMIWSLIGVVLFCLASQIPSRFWQRLAKPLFLCTVILLTLVLFWGPEISGAKRWLRFSGISFQPSELAKLSLIVLLADYVDRRQSRLTDFKKGLFPILLLAGIHLFLIFLEPDLGTPVLMTLVMGSLLVIGGARWKHLAAIGLAGGVLFYFSILQFRYRLVRFFAYLDPWADSQGAGYQLVQSLLAMGSGGILGQGLGNSQIKISNLPDPHTDFVFSVLGEELGLVGTLGCLGLFLFLCMRGLKVSTLAPTVFSRLLAAGISLMVGYQAVINMGVASGLFPTKGMPLPFISFGGTSLVVVLIMMGILTRISKEANDFSAKDGP